LMCSQSLAIEGSGVRIIRCIR